MHKNRNAILGPPLPTSQRDTLSERADEDAWIEDPPSCRLTDEEWNTIADSLDLSVRQLQIVQCIFDGYDEPSIGEELGLSSHTVHAHLNRLYKRMSVRSRCELIVHVFLAFLSRAPAGRI
ncbi:MAG: helix-turn-helix domain-containing protein [Planctomycetota bacterium]|jgi:DNA-binding NarL/FixJ family response regulator